MEQPILETARLVLRPFNMADAADVQQLAGAIEVADTTGNVPHPYLDGMAQAWISSHVSEFAQGINVTYAVILNGTLCGCVSLGVTPFHHRAELGYWLGVPYWNRGYTTEASAALLDFGFGALKLHRVTSSHMTRNPASGRVMQKLGMTHEGTLRQHFVKGNAYEDMEMYGLLDVDWQNRIAP